MLLYKKLLLMTFGTYLVIYIVYIVDGLELKEMNDSCWKTVHIGTMDKCFTVT